MSRIKNALFITGIDTEIGKTQACGALAKYFLQQGKKVYTQKWVETGAMSESYDLCEHQRIAQIAFNTAEPALHSPYVFKLAASPHLSAEQENEYIDHRRLIAASQTLAQQCDYLLIEGAGGVCVPLNDTHTISDVAKEMELPIVLVSSSRLGSINQTILSLAYCKQKQLEVRAVVYNTFFAESIQIENSTRQYLQAYLAREYPEAKWLELGGEVPEVLVSEGLGKLFN